MAYGTKHGVHYLRRWAALAECDPRTIARVLLGLPVMPMTLDRIQRALAQLGPEPARASGGEAARDPNDGEAA